LKVYRQTYSNLNPGAPWNDLNDLEFLRRIGAWRINRETGEQGLTIAGLLMFGTHYVIQEQFPYYMLDYQERPEAKTERRWVDRLTLDGTWSGNLYDFYRKTYRKLTADLKVPFEIKGGIRQDDTPVHIALREALANVLVHADYSDRASVLVVKRPDMFGFRNPGLMRVPIKIAMKGGEADCRNRTLHQMFRYVNIGEQAGSGIPKILAGWKNQSWQPPLLRELIEPYDQTIIELKMVDLFPSQLTDKLIESYGNKFTELCELERLITVLVYSDYYITHKELCQLTSAHTREVTLALVRLERIGIIGSTGTHRNKVYHSPEKEIPTPENGIGQYLADNLFITKPLSELDVNLNEKLAPELDSELNPELNPESKQKLIEQQYNLDKWESLKSISMIVRDGSKRLIPEEVVEKTILELCDGQAITLNDIAELLGRESSALRKKYLNPMVSDGRLQRVYPTIINHPKQGYYKP
jgi:hypothetical protein